MSLDPKTLQLFVRVLELGTIAAAAKREHIATAAISRRIGDLEAKLGVRLVERSNRGLVATAAGRALASLSHRVLNDLSSVRDQMVEFAQGLKGHVRVFASMPAISQFLPAELASFMKANPLVEVHLEERLSTEITRAIADNVADIGLLIRELPADGLEYHPYHDDELVVIVPRQHALARRRSVRFANTVEYDYVGYHAHSRVNAQLIRSASELGKPWKVCVQVYSYDALCRMVEAGLGIGVLPQRLAKGYAVALKIHTIALEEDWARRSMAICIRSRGALTPAARLLTEHLLLSAKPSRSVRK